MTVSQLNRQVSSLTFEVRGGVSIDVAAKLACTLRDRHRCEVVLVFQEERLVVRPWETAETLADRKSVV